MVISGGEDVLPVIRVINGDGDITSPGVPWG